MMDWGAFFLDLLKILGGLIAGAVIGFFIARNYMMQMGRKPSQKQVNQMMKAIAKNMD